MNTAKNDAEMANAATCAPVKARVRKSPSGSIGSATRESTAMNATRKATAPASSATIAVLVQPSSLPRSSASTSRKSPAVRVTWPGRSILRAFGSFDSWTARRVVTMHIRRGRGVDAHQAERKVNEEDEAPVEPARGRAADERPDREGGADRGAVGGERL